jgi:hypothetical protein
VSADVRPNPVILLAGSTVIAGILMVAGAEVDAPTFLLHHRGAFDGELEAVLTGINEEMWKRTG